jgi:hypothetical protein
MSEGEVRSAVESWVRGVTTDARPDAFVVRMEPYEVDGEVLAYIAHLNGEGFCLCGADDQVLPVYWYAPRGEYDPDVWDFQYILEEIASLTRKMNRAREVGSPEYTRWMSVLSERLGFWDDLVAGSVPTRRQERNARRDRVEPDSMSLVLTTEWAQGSPYNDSCPELPTTGYTVTAGCVAVAQAQIMNYWEWPISGTGVDTGFYEYRWSNVWLTWPLAVNPGLNIGGWKVGRLDYDTTNHLLRIKDYWDHMFYVDARDDSDSTGYKEALDSLWARMTEDTTWYWVNFANRTYQWDRMKDSADVMSPADSEAVATLVYDCGVSCHMNYHVHVSTTGNHALVSALENRFFYDNDAVVAYGAPPLNPITDEILWLRPFAVGGSDTAGRGSHSWVYFGYDKSTDPDRSFRMNMGWAGSGDGWFTYDTVATNGFVFAVNDYTRFIAPDTVRFVGGGTFISDGSPDDPYANIEWAIISAPDNSALVFKAGSENPFYGDSLVIDRPLTLMGREVTIRD